MPCAKKMLGCRVGCLHRQMVQEYRTAREYDEARMEQETRLYPGDVELWKQSNIMITFKQWLIGRRDWNREDLAG